MRPNKIFRYNPKLFPVLSSVKTPDINEIQVSPFVKKAAKPPRQDKALATGKRRQLANYFFTGYLGKHTNIFMANYSLFCSFVAPLFNQFA